MAFGDKLKEIFGDNNEEYTETTINGEKLNMNVKVVK